MFTCQVCGRQFLTDTEMGAHLRIHGVNLFPELMRLTALVKTIDNHNKALTKENGELKSRLRIVLP